MVKSLSFVVCVADREDFIITALILWGIVQSNYCKNGNVNEQLMLNNSTSEMGSLIFYHINILYIVNHYYR